MKTTIYCFSGTGNSLKIARELAVAIGECEVLGIPGLMKSPAPGAETERVGFVTPVYFFGIPRMVRRFVEKIDLRKAKYIFAVATPGGRGDILRQFQELLEDKGQKLDAGFTVKMPGNYLSFYTASSAAEQNEVFAKASRKLEEVAAAIKSGQTTVEKSALLVRLIAGLVYGPWLKGLPKKGGRFYAEENCNGCGLCEKVCPSDNISLINGRPHWSDRCEECYACLNFCPLMAIQINKKTKGQGRYHQPDITVDDIIALKE
jgi:ferredoxin/flavodoxin